MNASSDNAHKLHIGGVEQDAENDCEDTGWTRIEDGCMNWKCQKWEPGSKAPTHPKLEKQERNGGLFWACPKCGDCYGPAA